LEVSSHGLFSRQEEESSAPSFDNRELASIGIELEPDKLRALLEKRRVLQDREVFSDTLLDPKAVVSARSATGRGRERQPPTLTIQ
jgi:hypothetical protein